MQPVLLLGIIFLMTAKPQLTIAIGTIVVSALLGSASALPFLRAGDALVPMEPPKP